MQVYNPKKVFNYTHTSIYMPFIHVITSWLGNRKFNPSMQYKHHMRFHWIVWDLVHATFQMRIQCKISHMAAMCLKMISAMIWSLQINCGCQLEHTVVPETQHQRESTPCFLLTSTTLECAWLAITIRHTIFMKITLHSKIVKLR